MSVPVTAFKSGLWYRASVSVKNLLTLSFHLHVERGEHMLLSEGIINHKMCSASLKCIKLCCHVDIFMSPNATTALFFAFSSWHALTLKSMTGAGRSSLFGTSFASSNRCIRWRWCCYRRSRTWTTSWTCGYILVCHRSWICWSATTYLMVILPIFMLTESSTISCHITTAASFICFPTTVPASL